MCSTSRQWNSTDTSNAITCEALVKSNDQMFTKTWWKDDNQTTTHILVSFFWVGGWPHHRLVLQCTSAYVIIMLPGSLQSWILVWSLASSVEVKSLKDATTRNSSTANQVAEHVASPASRTHDATNGYWCCWRVLTKEFLSPASNRSMRTTSTHVRCCWYYKLKYYNFNLHKNQTSGLEMPWDALTLR